MKRIISFLILLIMVFTLGTCVAEGIMFRGIPWGSTADFTCDELNKGGLSLFLTTPEDYASIATYRVRNMVSAPMYGNASSEQGLTAFALDYPMDLKVAGYNPTSVFVWFVYKPLEGELVYDIKQTAFYAGMYTFAPENIEGMYSDLKEKLSSVYGECSDEGGQEKIEDIFGEKTISWSFIDAEQKVAVWKTEDSYLFLISNKMTEDADPTLYSDSIAVVYAAKESDIWIDEALAAQKRTNERLEKEKYGDGNTDGL